MVEKNRIQIFSADGARPVFNQFADRDFILCVVVHHGLPSRSRGTFGWPSRCPSAHAHRRRAARHYKHGLSIVVTERASTTPPTRGPKSKTVATVTARREDWRGVPPRAVRPERRKHLPGTSPQATRSVRMPLRPAPAAEASQW